MHIQKKATDEERELTLSPEDAAEKIFPAVPWGELLMGLFVPVSAVIVGWGAGWIQWASSSSSLVTVLLSTVIKVCALGAFVIWPLCGVVFPAKPEWGVIRRVVVSVGLIAPPVLSFLYYASGRGVTDLGDLVLLVVPPILYGALLFEECKRPWVFALSVGFGVAIPVLWLGDVLASFRPMWGYGVIDSTFYPVKIAASLLPPMTLAVGLLDREAKDRDWFRGVAWGLLILGAIHLGSGVLWPVLARLRGHTGAVPTPHWPLVLYPWLLLCFLRPERAKLKPTLWLLAGIGVCEVVTLTIETARLEVFRSALVAEAMRVASLGFLVYVGLSLARAIRGSRHYCVGLHLLRRP